MTCERCETECNGGFECPGKKLPPIEEMRLFRVGIKHPWPAWHGDTVSVVGDGVVPGECTYEGPMLLPEWQWLTELCDGALEVPCPWHARHVRVHGPWSGVIPADGLIPISDEAWMFANRHLGGVVDCEHERSRGEGSCPDCGMVMALCRPCSIAGGAGMPIYHCEPACGAEAKRLR